MRPLGDRGRYPWAHSLSPAPMPRHSAVVERSGSILPLRPTSTDYCIMPRPAATCASSEYQKKVNFLFYIRFIYFRHRVSCSPGWP